VFDFGGVGERMVGGSWTSRFQASAEAQADRAHEHEHPRPAEACVTRP
jgi:hypothetical protein